jgi:hypothetical protein
MMIINMKGGKEMEVTVIKVLDAKGLAFLLKMKVRT